MEGLGILFSIGKNIIGTIIPPIKKKFFDQPKIYLVFNFSSSSKRNAGLSSKNDRFAATPVTEIIYHNDLSWEYKLHFRNNSEHTAYNLKLLRPEGNFNVFPKIDSLKPLLSNEEIVYTIRFSDDLEGKGSDAMELIDKGPVVFNQDWIIEYTNVTGTKFYTIFNRTKLEHERNTFVWKTK